MTEDNFKKINNLIDEKKIDEAQFELSKLGPRFFENPEYLFLRGKIFYLNKLYYISIDTLLIALEFDQSDKIYNVLGNKVLSKKIYDVNLRVTAVNSLKDELSGIYRKET